MYKTREQALCLMQGAYDLHTHNAPSHFKRATDAFSLLREADKYGMSGVLLKSHYECSADVAYLTNMYAGTKAKAYGSLTLNWTVGGINPYAVEAAVKKGIRYIWMPTLDTENNMSFGRLPIEFFDRPGITVFDENGALKKSVYDVMEVVRKHGAYLATGHLRADEAIAVCKVGRELGVNMIMTHPDWSRTVVPLDQQIAAAKNGVLVEKVWFNVKEGNISERKMAESIRQIGPDNVFMVTDRGQYGHKLPPEALSDFIECMLEEGISENAIRMMVHNNPKRIVEE